VWKTPLSLAMKKQATQWMYKGTAYYCTKCGRVTLLVKCAERYGPHIICSAVKSETGGEKYVYQVRQY